jgi:ATP-binding cassette subfamily C protein
MSGNDCGVAAMATIAQHFELDVTYSALMELIQPGRRGSSLLDLRRAAEFLGLTARAQRGSYDEFVGALIPVLAHVKRLGSGHFVVVHQWTRDRVVIADPARGLKFTTRKEFGRAWSGFVLLVHP